MVIEDKRSKAGKYAISMLFIKLSKHIFCSTSRHFQIRTDPIGLSRLALVIFMMEYQLRESIGEKRRVEIDTRDVFSALLLQPKNSKIVPNRYSECALPCVSFQSKSWKLSLSFCKTTPNFKKKTLSEQRNAPRKWKENVKTSVERNKTCFW